MSGHSYPNCRLRTTPELRLRSTRRANGPADYALCDGGRVRRRRRGQEAHARPAERADPGRALLPRGIHQLPMLPGEFGVPFLYSTNGEVIWFHDVRHAAEPLAARSPASTRRSALDEMLDPRLRRRDRASSRAIPHEPAAPALPDGRQRRRRAGHRASASARCSSRWRPAPARPYDGQRGLPPDEVRRRPARPLPRRPPRPGRAGRPGVRLVRGRAGPEVRQDLRGLLPALPAGDFEEDEKFDPKVLPNSLLTDPKLGDAFVYVCTIQRMTINLFGGDGALDARRRGRSTTTPSSSTSRSTPST